jgi:hypothetical protein
MKIYILKLKESKYYIGKTKNGVTRIMHHFSDQGSKWTKKYEPISVDKIIYKADEFDEDKWVKIYMNKYGIDNVRGGTYSNMKLHFTTVQFLEREFNHAREQCFTCEKYGHLSTDCSTGTKYVVKKMFCGNCGGRSHNSNTCYIKNVFKEGIKKCSNCGKDGHYNFECFRKLNKNYQYD